MKPAVIIFHKNIDQYPKEWAKMCLKSIRNQTYKKFTVLEIDYGGTDNQIYSGSLFFNMHMDTHAHAHNFLCLKAVEMGYDCVFNVNVDDAYHYERIEKQLPYMEAGYDVVSCNMTQMDAKNFILRENIQFSDMDIELQAIEKNHNCLAHPAVCYSKNFIENSGLLIPSEIPKDDFKLWKRSYAKFKFKIIPYTLLFYRIHDSNISGKNRQK